MKQQIISLLERAKENGTTIGDVLAEVRGMCPVCLTCDDPEMQDAYAAMLAAAPSPVAGDMASAMLAAGHPYWQGFQPTSADDRVDLFTAGQLRAAILADRASCPAVDATVAPGENVTPADAVYGLMAWLTGREEPVTLSARHGAAIAADLAAAFCESNGLTRFSVSYPHNLKYPHAEASRPAPPAADERAQVAEGLPGWEQVSAKLARGQTLTPLEVFVHENEPAGDDADAWRNQLSAALASAPVANPTLPLEHALHELISKIAPGLDTGDILQDARRASVALSSIMASAPTADGRDAAAKDVGLPDVLDAALNNLLHDNYERSYSGGKNREADVALIRAAIAAQQGEGGK